MEFNIQNVITTQDNLIAVQVDTLDQLMSDPYLLWWDELAEDTSIAGAREVRNWYVQNGLIRETSGGDRRFYDGVDAAFELSYKKYEASTSVDRDEWEDDKIDRAAQWAVNVSTYEALHPQVLTLNLIQNGKVYLAFDGVTFFSTLHPVVPGVAGSGTNSNLWSGYPLTPAGIKDLTADIKGTLKTYGLPNAYIRPYRLWLNPATEFDGAELLGAEIIGNLVADGINGSKSNLLADQAFKNRYGWDGGIRVMQDMPNNATQYHVQCKVFGRTPWKQPFIRVTRRPGEMRMFGPSDSAHLSRANRVEWHKDYRFAMMYGDPMGLHEVSTV